MKKTRIGFLGWLLLGLAGAPALWSQQSQAPDDQNMVRAVKKDYCSLGFLVQSVADFQPERTLVGSNGFSIANVRILVSGRLQGSFGYLIQTSMIKSPALLDAKVYYEFSPAFAMDFGQFKAPFSAEYLIYAGNIDFVNRSQVVSALAPGRQIGLQGRVWIADRKVLLCRRRFQRQWHRRQQQRQQRFTLRWTNRFLSRCAHRPFLERPHGNRPQCRFQQR